MFAWKISKVPSNIVQVPIYMCLLTVTCLYNKAAVVTKMPVKCICLGVTMGVRSSRYIDNYADCSSGWICMMW